MNNIDLHSSCEPHKHKSARSVQYGLEIIFKQIQMNYS